jgi:hypothetical protein
MFGLTATKSKFFATKSKPGTTNSKSGATKSKFKSLNFLRRIEPYQGVTPTPHGILQLPAALVLRSLAKGRCVSKRLP